MDDALQGKTVGNRAVAVDTGGPAVNAPIDPSAEAEPLDRGVAARLARAFGIADQSDFDRIVAEADQTSCVALDIVALRR